MIKEFNNRKIADKHAEFITGQELRKYLARKVKKYIGESPTVFDGACGSGQLEEHIGASFIKGVEIQEKACQVFKENYPNSSVDNISFFNFKSDEQYDCVIMNYPFSLKFKELSEEEQKNIQDEFSWKKSGVVDDIFILKSLNYTKRFAFYIGFPGIRYRKAEAKLRELLSGQIAELNIIRNAFEDTAIEVIFLVIDKHKQTEGVCKEIYDCKTKAIIHSEETSDADEWEQVYEPIPEPEKIDPTVTETEAQAKVIRKIRFQLNFTAMVADLEDNQNLLTEFIKKIRREVDDFERSKANETDSSSNLRHNVGTWT